MTPEEIAGAFHAEGRSSWCGNVYGGGFPVFRAPVFRTAEAKTRYLQEPGVAGLAYTITNPLSLEDFLNGFDPELKFRYYLGDREEWAVGDMEVTKEGATFEADPSGELLAVPHSAQLIKIAGQLCYMSFGPDRTWNRDTRQYLHTIIASGHGSVLEHSNATLLFYGVSRSLTHELVRHRAGMAYSQVSQRYVDGSRLRFVERPEYQDDPELHRQFEQEIDRQAALYEDTAQRLLQRQAAGAELLSGEKKRDRRKKVNQAARSVLGNHAEAPIVVTGNLRAWRHVFSMRASEHAEVEIRRAMYRAFLCLAMLDPITFGDFRIVKYADGTKGVATAYPKV